jgi:predicted amidophosphoribosyltransferase
MTELKIGEKSCLLQCEDCKEFFYELEYNSKWCEDCFDKGLHRDMNEHFANYFKQEFESMFFAYYLNHGNGD